MLVHWIWLAIRPGMHDRDKEALLQHFPDAEDIYFAEREDFLALDDLKASVLDALDDKDLTSSQEILRKCTDQGIQICAWNDPQYPARLKNIPDPPMVLYYKGTMPRFDEEPVVAIVGTRKPSAYGISTAKRMGYQIARCGATVVSGMAYGIDGVALSGALTAGGSVVGVLGCGVDVVYPASNRMLFSDVEQRGCLISEFPPETPPHKWNFPKRNRIISGLSCGVLVIEAPAKSGSLITAKLAADQGREVFVVPGNVDMPSFEGSNDLLRQGAIMAGNGWDVAGEYENQYPGKMVRFSGSENLEIRMGSVETALPRVAQHSQRPVKKSAVQNENDKKSIDNRSLEAYIDVDNSISEEEKRLLSFLAQGECHYDDLIAGLQLPAGKILGMLTMLEIRGRIARMPGNRVKIKG